MERIPRTRRRPEKVPDELRKKGSGGARKGAGRKAGQRSRRTEADQLEAIKSGKLPHQLLLQWAQTGVMEGEVLSAGVRIEAAKAAAPYYAPRLAALQHTGKDGGPIEHRINARDIIEQRCAAMSTRLQDEERPEGSMLN